MQTHTPGAALHFDALIVGSRLAGLSAALLLAQQNKRVAIITKRAVREGSSGWAQGGIAAGVGQGTTALPRTWTTRWWPVPGCATWRPRSL
jgi:aspartate oxidase